LNQHMEKHVDTSFNARHAHYIIAKLYP